MLLSKIIVSVNFACVAMFYGRSTAIFVRRITRVVVVS